MKRHERCSISGRCLRASTLKYHYFHCFFTDSVKWKLDPKRVHSSRTKHSGCRLLTGSSPPTECNPVRGQCQAGSLSGAEHLSKGNAGVLRLAQRGQKPRVEQKGKCWLDPDFQYEYGPRKRGLSILLSVESFKQEVSEKLPQG